MAAIPQEYESSVCEIRTMQNEMIATGIISEISEEYIEIKAKDQVMSMIRYGETIKVNVVNYKKGIRVLAGKVYISNSKMMRLVDVITLLECERRNFYRVNCSLDALAIVSQKLSHGKGEEPEEQVEEIKLKVINLSLGGALFSSDREFARGERILLKVKLGKQNCCFKCIVGRSQTINESATLYGCKFSGASEKEQSALCTFIFQQQRLQRNTARVEEEI